MSGKKKHNYTIVVPNCNPVTIYNAPSPQNACRKAFRSLIKSGSLKQQPPTDDTGGFQGVIVYVI